MVKPNYRNVVVLMGGLSSEREVSLRSGAAIAGALNEAGCVVTQLILNEEPLSELPPDCQAVFIALHGGYGENGGVQRDLERLKMPYTGSKPKASEIAMDKIVTKRILAAHGIPTARYQIVHNCEEACEIPFPVVVKPPRDGSSVGLTCPCSAKDWPEAIALAQRVDPEVLVEQYIAGREWTVTVLERRALPVIEIIPESGVYDYKSKYTTGQTAYRPLKETALTIKAQEMAVKACEATGVEGVARVDFRVTDTDGLFVLEINTLPGFTATSLVPKAAKEAGISFTDLCVRILNMA